MERMGRWNGAEVALTEVKLVGGCQCCMRNGNSRAQVANLRWPCNGVTEILMLRESGGSPDERMNGRSDNAT